VRLHDHYVCECDYDGMEIVDTMWCLLLTAHASRMGVCSMCGTVVFNHVSEVSKYLCEMIPKPRVSGSSPHNAALCRQVFAA
jgi:hypothetical protein